MSLLLLVGCLQSALAIMRESPLQAMAHAGWGGTHARWVALVCDGDTMWAVSPPKPATLWQLAFMWSNGWVVCGWAPTGRVASAAQHAVFTARRVQFV